MVDALEMANVERHELRAQIEGLRQTVGAGNVGRRAISVQLEGLHRGMEAANAEHHVMRGQLRVNSDVRMVPFVCEERRDTYGSVRDIVVGELGKG